MVKKSVKKKTASKKTAKKAVASSRPSIKRAKTAFTKTDLFTTIAENTGLAKKEVSAVFEVLGDVVEAHISKGAVGQFTLPGLLKVKTIRKKATKARKGINPFTGEETVFKAKPARTVVKVLPLKKMKDMVA